MVNYLFQSGRIIKAKAFAKINLSLDIVGRRNDGYHEVCMIMQSIDLHDLLTFSPSPDISLQTSDPFLPINDDNLIIKTAKLLKKYTGVKSGVKIHLQKNIPVGAGLGGGSADAAATFMALNQLWELNLSLAELKNLAVDIGADVPFCLIGGTILAEGIGEKLLVLPGLPQAKLILAKPPFSVSTKTVYKKFDFDQMIKNPRAGRPATKKIIDLINAGDVMSITKYWGNVLEEVTLRLYPTIRERITEISSYGLPVRMSGSGPTIFTLFPDYFTESDQINKDLKEKGWWTYEGYFQKEGNKLLLEKGEDYG